jgi:hypothetical protein
VFENRVLRSVFGPTLPTWVDNVKMDLGKGWGGMGWTDLAQDRDQRKALVSMVGNEPLGSIKCWEVVE